jgi:hypothetical protein
MAYVSMSCSACDRVYAGSDMILVSVDYYQHVVDDHENDEEIDIEAAKESLETFKEKDRDRGLCTHCEDKK